MVATRSNAGQMVNRQSFTGKDMTFIEVVFGAAVATTATTPDTAGSSQFERVAQIIQGTASSSGATIMAQTYELGKKATEQDVNDAPGDLGITEDDLVDVYKFIVEGDGESFAAGSTAVGLDSTRPATNLETDILSVVDSNDSSANVFVRVGTLQSEGTASTGSTGRIFDARV